MYIEVKNWIKLLNVLNLNNMYLRALFDTFPEWIANDALQCTSFGLLHELIINTLMYKRARSSTTALSLANS
jgi:hypothetical protein